MAVVQIVGNAQEGNGIIASTRAGDFSGLPMDAALDTELSGKVAVAVAAGAVDVVVNLNGITKLKFLAASTSAPVTLKLTSASGADQKVPLTKTAHVVSEEVPYTGIKIDGGLADAVVTLIIGGDPA